MFSISDARNDAGEWTMSPEQIHAEEYADFEANYYEPDEYDLRRYYYQDDPETCEHLDCSKSNDGEWTCDNCARTTRLERAIPFTQGFWEFDGSLCYNPVWL